MRRTISRAEAIDQLLSLGVEPGGALVVHPAFSKLAPIEGEPRGLIASSATILTDGRPARHDYDEIDHCREGFALMDRWLEQETRQRRGRVGHGEARLARSRDVGEVALARLRENETAFLHPPGVDGEGDEARASLAAQRTD